MSLHVSSERVDVTEVLAALAAVVRPLLRVVLHVVLQRRALQEALVTEAAAVGLLSGVRPRVTDQRRGEVETLAADAAAVRLLVRVHPHVGLQVVLAAEALPADGAAERLLARVAARVHRQVQMPREGFAAVIADVGHDVRLQVVQQVPPVGQQLAAHAAEAVLVVGVDLRVVDQGAAVAEHLPTDFTAPERAAALSLLALGSRRRREEGGARHHVLVFHLHLQNLLRRHRLHLRLLALTLHDVGEVFGVLLHLYLRSLSLNHRTGPHLLLLLFRLLFDGRRPQLLLVRLLLEVEALELLNICR